MHAFLINLVNLEELIRQEAYRTYQNYEEREF
jgi:hypothetical protein